MNDQSIRAAVLAALALQRAGRTDLLAQAVGSPDVLGALQAAIATAKREQQHADGIAAVIAAAANAARVTA